MDNYTKNEEETFKLVKRVQSFENACRGIKVFLKTTHNAWIEIIIGILTIVAGFYFDISMTEWMFIILSIGFVLVTEAINTAFEFDIDLTSPDFHKFAKYTKDIAAGAVLIASITSAIIGLIIFIPKIIIIL